MARSDVERLTEAIANGPTSRDEVRAFVRAAERMSAAIAYDPPQSQIAEQCAAARAYDRVKARILGEKSRG